MLWPRESKWMLHTLTLTRSLAQSPIVSLSLSLEDKGCISRQNSGWGTGSTGPEEPQLVVQSLGNGQ